MPPPPPPPVHITSSPRLTRKLAAERQKQRRRLGSMKGEANRSATRDNLAIGRSIEGESQDERFPRLVDQQLEKERLDSGVGYR